MTTQRRVDMFLHAPMALIRALLLAFLGTAIIGWSWSQNSAIIAYFVPSTYWISEMALTIPDHESGDDPLVAFDRTVSRRFVGAYVTEFRIAGDGAREVCSNTGTARYEPQKDSQWIGRLSTYTNGCTIPPGCWRADTTIQFPVWGGASKAVHVKSAPFAVSSGSAVPAPCQEIRS